jgi:hypothetical protein
VPSCAAVTFTAHVENGDDQRLQFLLDSLGERRIENPAGGVEGQFSHSVQP